MIVMQIALTLYAAIGVTCAWDAGRSDEVEAFRANHGDWHGLIGEFIGWMVLATCWLPITLYVCACHLLGRSA